MFEARPPGGRRRTLVREVNPHLICVLCSGYFIEATTIVECLHTFCRSCLVKYLENSKFCPKCDVQLHKNNPLLSVRCDPTLQQLVYKLIPGLYSNEMARRRKYYSELGGPTSDPDCGVFPIGDQYFSPDDSISLSLEFINGAKDEESGSDTDESSAEKQAGMNSVHHRRYLQCPAAVTMSHLKKFLRMKYCLSQDHKVDIIYGGEVLTDDFSLMDVAYTFSWNKTTPMRFKFRLLQRYSVPVPDTPPTKDLEIRESTSPPSVHSEPELTVHKESAPKLQLKTLTVQVQKLSSNIVEPLFYKSDIKPNKQSIESSVAINNNNNNNNNNNYGPPKVKPLVRHKPGPKSRTEGRTRIEIKPTIKTSPDRGNMMLKRPLHSDEDPLQLHEDNEPEKKKSKFLNNTEYNKNSIHLSDNESESMSPLEQIYDEPLEERKRKMEEEERRKKKEEEEEKRKRKEEEEKRKKKEEEEKRKKREEEEKRRRREEEERKRKREEEEKKKRKEEEEKRKKREEEERRRKKEEEDRRRKKEEEERRKKKEEKMLAEEKKNYDDDIYEIGKWHMDSKKFEEKKLAAEKMEVDDDLTEEVKITRAVKEEQAIEGKSAKEENSNNIEKKNVVNEDIKNELEKQRYDENEMKRKLTKDKSYLEDDDDENSLRIMTPPVEDMSVDEIVPEQAPPPLIAEVQPIMRSEERRKEKKKSKKAKHHHHHRHHDRKRDSPPAATILHSSENDIMKLKIKLTEVNSKVPKYSVVDGNSEERKEPKENGHSHKLAEKEKEKIKEKEKEKSLEKNKVKDEEPKMIAEIVKDKNEYNNSQNSRVEPICKDKLQQQIRPPRPKIPSKPVINTKPSVPVKQDVANVKPIMQSPPIKIQSPPPRQSPSPKSVPSPKPAPISKPSPPPTPKLNGTLEPLKMPPSTITVSKITAEEKRQMEQQKLLMSRNNNNGLDSKRPSLEIMLVNAPKKAETLASSAGQQLTETKPVPVKKVMRPTPPSIPLSRLGKGVGFGPKGSPPPLVLANKATCHDETGALDLSGKSSRKSPEIDKIAMRNLMTLSDTAVQIRNGIIPDMNSTTNPTSQLKIPIPGLTKPVYQPQHQRTIKPGQNQTVRQIPNPSALMFRQHTINGRSLPPPGVPLSSLTKMESMTRNLEKVTACLTVKAAGEAAAYASK